MSTSVNLWGVLVSRWISINASRSRGFNITTPSWTCAGKEYPCVLIILQFEVVFFLLIFFPLALHISLFFLSAHWLQWEASKPADVHWHGRWPVFEAACFLSGPPHHWENSGYSQPGNPDCKHQGSGDSTPSWKQHVCQVTSRPILFYITPNPFTTLVHTFVQI